MYPETGRVRKDRKTMKKTIIEKFIVGLLTAAMVFTAAPEVGALTNANVSAYAKTKEKAAKVTINFNRNDGYANGYYVGKQTIDGYNFITIQNMKSSAKYTFTTNSKNLSIKADAKATKKLLKQWGEKGNWTKYPENVQYVINSKKAGTYKVSVKEKYKKKTRTLKTFNLNIYDINPVSTYTAYVKTSFNLNNLMIKPCRGYLPYPNFDDEYFSKDIEEDTDESTLNLTPKKEGTTTITFYNLNDTEKKNPYTVNVTIKANHLKAIKYGDWAGSYKKGIINAYIYDNPNENVDYYLDDYYHLVGEADSSDYTPGILSNHAYIVEEDELNITSADPSIFKVTNNIDEDGYSSWSGTALNVGDTSITITCAGQSLTIQVHVKKCSDDVL